MSLPAIDKPEQREIHDHGMTPAVIRAGLLARRSVGSKAHEPTKLSGLVAAGMDGDLLRSKTKQERID
jgi:hypothetical protein